MNRKKYCAHNEIYKEVGILYCSNEINELSTRIF